MSFKKHVGNGQQTSIISIILCYSTTAEILGRFPSDEEAKKYDIPEKIPVWLPTGVEILSWFDEFITKNKKQLFARYVSVFVFLNYCLNVIFSSFSDGGEYMEDGEIA